MNVLLVGKGSKNYPSTVGNIISNIVDSPTFRDDYFFVLCAKSKFTTNLKGQNFEHLEYEDYVITHKESDKRLSLLARFVYFIRKAFTYIYSHLIIDYDHLSFLLARRKAYRLCKNIKVDCVLGMAGVFSSFDLAHFLAKKLGVALVLYYFDVFSPDIMLTGNHRFAVKKESKWQESAKAILMPRSYKLLYSQSGFDTRKYVDCLFPSFLRTGYTKREKTQGKDLVYAGGFYDKIREPDEFLMIAKRFVQLGYRVVCYGQSQKAMIRKFGPSPLYDNVIWKTTLAYDDLIAVLGEAAALINIENKYGIRFPSKMLQYLGFGKLIINLNAGRKQVREYLDKEYEQIISSNDYYKTINDQSGVAQYLEGVIKMIDTPFAPVLLNDDITMDIRKVLLDVLASK